RQIPAAAGRPRRRDAPRRSAVEEGGVDQPPDRGAAGVRRAHRRAEVPRDPPALVRGGGVMSGAGASGDRDGAGETELPTALLRLLERACDRFEAACKAGRRPRVEDYLGQMPEAGRPELVSALKALEQAYRDRGAVPSSLPPEQLVSRSVTLTA